MGVNDGSISHIFCLSTMTTVAVFLTDVPISLNRDDPEPITIVRRR